MAVNLSVTNNNYVQLITTCFRWLDTAGYIVVNRR